MMFFCGTFGALVPCEQQGGHHQGGQRDGAHGRRAQLKRPPRVRVRTARDNPVILEIFFKKILIHVLTQKIFILYHEL